MNGGSTQLAEGRRKGGGDDLGDFSQSQLDEFVEKLLRNWDEEEPVTD